MTQDNIIEKRHTCHKFLFAVREDGFVFSCAKCKEGNEVIVPFEQMLVMIAAAMERRTARLLQSK